MFTGVCTALVTPFDASGVNYKKLDQLLDHQMENGIGAVCVCGTTGEAATMTQDEQMSVIAHTVQYCSGKIKVIAGTGSNNTAHAVTLSKMAGAMGADAVLVVTPYYNKTNPKGLVEHYTAVADAASCPVIMYNVPSRTGVDIPVDVYKTLSDHQNIGGVKEASGSITKAARILAACGDGLPVWSGNDDEIVPMMALGAKGVISVLSNLCPARVLAMSSACLGGDYAAAGKLQCHSMELIDALFSDINPVPVKEAMNLLGMEVGTPRLPLCPMAEDKRKKLESVLKKVF